MSKSAHVIHLLIVLISLVITPVRAVSETPDILDIGKHYLEAMYDSDLSEFEQSLHPEAIYDDPTAIEFDGKAWHIVGRMAIVEFIRESSEGVLDAGFEIRSAFSTGGFAVFNLNYLSTFDGELLGMPGKVLSIDVPAVTILRVEEGLVIHHTDHVDYALMHKQLAKQRE